MASLINASTTGLGGIITTGDNSGSLALQTGGTTALTIDSSQNVGIGTTTPAGALDVSRSGNIYISNKTSAPTNTAQVPGTLIFAGTGWNTQVGSQPIAGQIGLAAVYGALNGGSTEPAITFSLQGTGSGTYNTTAGPTTLTERMRLDNYGRLGIGTTTPSALLHVYNTGGSTNSVNTALIVGYDSTAATTTGAGTAIELRGTSSGGNIANYSQARIRSTSQPTNNAHGIAFDYKPNAASALTEGMRIDTDGTVYLNGASSQGGVRTRSGTFSLPSNSGTVITITLSNYSYMHFKFYALRTNGGNSMAYWDGILNNNNNSSYTNAIAQSSGAGAVTFTVASGSAGVWTFTFNFNGSGGYGYYICEDMNMGSISVAYP